jgi:hypothetical protein
MTRIKGYSFNDLKPLLHVGVRNFGGYDADNKKFVPMTLSDEDVGWEVYEVLDALTAAVEDGLVKSSWHKQLFKTPADLEAFFERLSVFDEESRIHDRWWHALARMCKHDDSEAGFIACIDIVDNMKEYVQEHK